MSILGKPTNVDPDEFPFYEEEDLAMPPPVEQQVSVENNASTLSNYRVSRASNPSPNTLVPILPSGLLPTSVIPSVALGYVLGRDGVTQYNLVVENDGALAIDPA